MSTDSVPKPWNYESEEDYLEALFEWSVQYDENNDEYIDSKNINL